MIELETTARTSQEAAEALGVEVGADREVAGVHRERRADHGGGVGSEPRRRGQGGRPRGRVESSAGADPVRQATGFAIGGIPPFGHASTLPIWIDADLGPA